MTQNRLVVVSNRLPITIEASGDELRFQPSCGGLVSALLPVLREEGGCWVGSTGGAHNEKVAEALKKWCATQNYALAPVFLNAAERASFYQGCSNEIIWPLFHGLPSRCKFRSAYWTGYRKANEKFADVVGRVWKPGDFVWIHDYHLMLLAGILRSRGAGYRLAYFHHIPFPPPEVFHKLPWRMDLLRALTQFDVLGFQTSRDRRNFIACLRHCLSGVRLYHIGEKLLVRSAGHRAAVGNYPISIDYETLAGEATSPEVLSAMEAIRQGSSRTSIIVGVDRLDYTKGIPERLTAFETLLESHAELRGHVTMVQIVVPSREDIPEYNELKLRIERMVGRINGEYGSPGWVPIHYLHRCLSRTELIALYRVADVALVTPLRDGMNLVAKEFCASRVDHRGVLVLSEFAGAAEELSQGALLVNPHHTQKMASVLYFALAMSEAEQEERMEAMRSHIREHDVFQWARSFRAESVPPPRVAPSKEKAGVLSYSA